MTGLVETAIRLASAKPTQTDLKRAVSTAYYAVFDALARHCADLLVGADRRRTRETWGHIYRSLDHGLARKVCLRAAALGFAPAIAEFATAFATLQERRHEADYDPLARFTRAEAFDLVSQAEAAIARLAQASSAERKAFAIHLLLKKRG